MDHITLDKRKTLSFSGKGWGFVFWGLLILSIFLIRLFCAESFRISTHSMEDALYPGDYVLVNKLPLKNNPGRNRIILFHSPLLRDSLNSPLLVSRCIGMPGDTIWVNEKGFIVNGKELPRSPHTLSYYHIAPTIGKNFLEALNKLKINSRDITTDSTGIRINLTPFEAYQLQEELSEEENHLFQLEPTEQYSFIIPQKGRAYRLDSISVIACREAILTETKGEAIFENDRIIVDGKEINFFFFSQDYYWVLSDNISEAIDSRHLGMIPANHIIGNIFFCWYSKDRERKFKIIR